MLILRKSFHLCLLTGMCASTLSLTVQVNVAKDVMLKNMETMMIRQDKLDTMVDKSDGLLDAANQFQKAGGKLRSHMWWQVCTRALFYL